MNNLNDLTSSRYLISTLTYSANSGGNPEQSSSGEQSKTETILSDATTTDDLLLSLLTNSSLLSASDVSGLYDTGMFDNISSLTGSSLSSSLFSSSNLSTTLVLKEILQSLEELKEEQKKATPAQKEVYEAKKQDSETFKTRNPSILRFKINNYSINDTITQTFFSEPEADGSFLLTADRKYFVNGKSCSETFYMLFRAIKSNGASTSYSVTASIAQSFENKSSFLYKLCQQKDLTAEKTGNLVVLNYSKGDLSADLLMDIDK